jgi:hypothetical protein
MQKHAYVFINILRCCIGAERCCCHCYLLLHFVPGAVAFRDPLKVISFQFECFLVSAGVETSSF